VRFSAAEAEFLQAQRVGRLATVSPRGWPHVMPVAYQLLDDGGLEFDADGAKLRNLTAEPRAALVVDASHPKRGVSVQGTTRVIGAERVRLQPEHHTSWGL
jgi:pyridoxamine 5'-phosphate oxidase family protein